MENHFIISNSRKRTFILFIYFALSTVYVFTYYDNLRAEEEEKIPRVKLRSSCGNIADEAIVVKKYNFYDKFDNKTGDFVNDYELKVINGDKIVIDHATGLLWHQSGSKECISWEKTMEWIKNLNNTGYAGYSNWRLPTMEEAASLLESSEMNNDLHIDQVFDKRQKWIWTGDSYGSDGKWLVNFSCGCIFWRNIGARYIRPVHSNQ